MLLKAIFIFREVCSRLRFASTCLHDAQTISTIIFFDRFKLLLINMPLIVLGL